MHWLKFTSTLALAAVGAGMASSAEGEGAHYYPPPESLGGWRTLVRRNVVPNPEQKAAVLSTTGLDTDKLVDAWKYVESLGRRQSLLVIRHGWIAAEWDYVDIGPVNSAVVAPRTPSSSANMPRTNGVAEASVAIERWDTYERSLSAANAYANPFQDVQVTATFTGKPGDAYLVYTLGGGMGTVRLAPGRYAVSRVDPRNRTRTGMGLAEGGAVNFSLPPGDWALIYRRMATGAK